jgi:mRNA-degrading endonuclease RelE of RelBE toxin-antitoxin system
MTYTVVWRNEARQALSRLRAGDLVSAKLVTAAVRALADDPYPSISNQLGSSRFWRLRLADLRVVYEVDDTPKAIYIYSIGRVQPPHQR